MADHLEAGGGVPGQLVDDGAQLARQTGSVAFAGDADEGVEGGHLGGQRLGRGAQGGGLVGDLVLQLLEVGAGQVGVEVDPEQQTGRLDGVGPLLGVRQRDRLQVHPRIDVLEGRLHAEGAAVMGPGTVAGGRPGDHVEVDGVLVEAGVGMQLLDRVGDRLHRHGLSRVQAGATQLGVDVRQLLAVGVLVEGQVGLEDLGEVQRRQDRPGSLALVRRQVRAEGAVPGCPAQGVCDTVEVGGGEQPLRIETGVGRVPGGEQRFQEAVTGVGEIRPGGLGHGDGGVEALERFLPLGESDTRLGAVCLGEFPLQGGVEGLRARTKDLFDGLPGVLRDPRGVVAPPVVAQQVLDDDQLAELGHLLVGEELREPHHGEGGLTVRDTQLVDALVVLGGGVAGFVEGVVDDQAQGLGLEGAEVRVLEVGLVPDVAEDDLRPAGGAPPGDRPGQRTVGRRGHVRHPQRSGKH